VRIEPCVKSRVVPTNVSRNTEKKELLSAVVDGALPSKDINKTPNKIEKRRLISAPKDIRVLSPSGDAANNYRAAELDKFLTHDSEDLNTTEKNFEAVRVSWLRKVPRLRRLDERKGYAFPGAQNFVRLRLHSEAYSPLITGGEAASTLPRKTIIENPSYNSPMMKQIRGSTI
jgi:hypothetical protein